MRIELNGYIINELVSDCFAVATRAGFVEFTTCDLDAALAYVRTHQIGETMFTYMGFEVSRIGTSFQAVCDDEVMFSDSLAVLTRRIDLFFKVKA